MNTPTKGITPRVIVMMLFFVVVVPFLPLLISQRWGWGEAWAYAVISILGFVISRALAAQRHPDLIAERGRMLQHEDTAPWDKWLAPLVGLGGGLIPLVAGLDALLVHTTPFNPLVQIIALILILAGYALGSYALIENRFFSGVVRIQKDRDHHIVTTGPYRWMRHPGYAGALLAYLATPLFLNTPWAFLPALFLTIVLIIRTKWEDETLQEHLEGYREYAQQVHYRLLPGIW
jgi:protein-S-isoprenylcysteine O-methyltransferase Ste14